MTRIDFSAADWEALEHYLLANQLEQGAFCLAEPIGDENELRLLVREVITVPPERLIQQSGTYLETDPVFFAPIIKRARNERYSLVVAHSHPFAHGRVAFSSTDDRGETALIPSIQARAPSLPHAALVLGHGVAAARIYESGRQRPVESSVRVIGASIRDIHAHSPGIDAIDEKRFDRQVRVWGVQVQQRLASLHVGVIGHGGIGSHVTQQLHHLGIETLVVDPDVVDETSLNRLVGATAADARERRPKISVSERVAASLEQKSCALQASALDQKTALLLSRCDAIFGCTDDLASRRLLNRLALQYYVPLIDLGMDLERDDDGALRTGAGRVTLVMPDGPCLHRAGVLVGTETEPGYIRRDNDPRPAVIAFNGIVASLGIATLLALIGAIPTQVFSQINYLPLKGRIMHEALHGLCADCTDIRGVGASRPLPWNYHPAAEDVS
jgi:molybdopterin-synthase adenylyltransferase